MLVEDVQISKDIMTINISALCKQSRPKYHQRPLKFTRYKTRPNLCIVSLMEHYFRITKDLRNAGCDRLFITSVPPYRNASKDTLSNWTKAILKKAGLGSQFTAHSVRGASVSKCLMKSSTSIDTVLKAGGWSSESVFRKHYDLPIQEYSGLDKLLL